MTHYETLGVDRDANADAIKKAYRRAAAKSHPDRKGGSEEAMKAVDEAYACLGDPLKRAAYDAGADHSEEELRISADLTFNQLLEICIDEGARDVMVSVGIRLANALSTFDSSLADLARKRKKLARWRGRVLRKTEGSNAVEAILDKKLLDIDERVNEAVRNRDVTLRAIQFLSDYEDKGDAPEPGSIFARLAMGERP